MHEGDGPRGRDRRLSIGRVLIGVAAAALALVAVFAGGLVDWLACENDTSEACGRQDLAHVQWAVAWIGLAPTLLFAVAFASRRRRLATVAFVTAAATYLAWAVLADAAHHGWDDLKFFPSF